MTDDRALLGKQSSKLITRRIKGLRTNGLLHSHTVRFFQLLFVVQALALTALTQEAASGSVGHDNAGVSNGLVQGTILDASGATMSGVRVTLTGSQTGAAYSTRTDPAGRYSFTGLQAEEFKIEASLSGFDPFMIAGIALTSGQNLELLPIVMHLAIVASKVEVVASQREVAEAQMKSETKQRLLGVLPNYYVVYFRDPAPLSAGQKMRLALRLSIDPVNIGIDAAQAGLQTNSENFAEYGTGAEGFAKRFAAAYAGDVIGTMIGSGLLPALLRQDPRYYYKGTGTVTSRILYALSWSFRCKGDNGKWQFNYSSILGNIATTSISNLYLPKAIRDDPSQTLKYSVLSLASQGMSALLQEFVFKRLTSHANDPGKVGTSDPQFAPSHPEPAVNINDKY